MPCGATVRGDLGDLVDDYFGQHWSHRDRKRRRAERCLRRSRAARFVRFDLALDAPVLRPGSARQFHPRDCSGQLQRLVASLVGYRWAELEGALLASLGCRTQAQRRASAWVRSAVLREAVVREGEVYSVGWGRLDDRPLFRGHGGWQFYVHPEDGTLCALPPRFRVQPGDR